MATTLTQEQVRELATTELIKRGRLNGLGRCTLCGDIPENHVNPMTQKFVGCGAARKGSLTGQPWIPEGRYTLVMDDFPRRAIRSEQERIAYSVVKALARSQNVITSANLADANPTWTVRDAYRLLQALAHRGILNRIDAALATEDETEAIQPEGPTTQPEMTLPPAENAE